MPKFTVTLSALQGVLSYTRSYQIPRYQRPYTWKVGRVEELWDDLVVGYKDQGRMGEEYLLGSIVTVESGKKNEVVDGQQRLVSLTLMFCALRDSLRDRLKKSNSEVNKHAENLIIEMEKRISGDCGPTIVLNNNDDQVLLNAICNGDEIDNLKKNASKAFLINYKKFRSRSDELYNQINVVSSDLTGLKKLGEIIDAIINRVFLVHVETKDEYEAGQIFQALNSKNQTLTQADLIKNYLIQQQSEGMESAWNEAFTPFEDILNSKPEKADDYIYDSMMSRYCQLGSKDVGKKYLYKAVKKEEVDGDHESAEIFVAKLKVDMKIIHRLENPSSSTSDLAHQLYGLKQVNARYFRRSVVAAVRLWGWKDTRTHDLIDLLLKFFFMYKTVLKMDVDEIRNVARKLTKKLVGDPNRIKLTDLYEIVLDPIYKSNDKNREDLEDFHTRFNNHFIVQQYRDNPIKYIFICIERELQKEFNVMPEGYDVEHVFPQKANSVTWPNDTKLKPYKNNIGNLTLLPRKWNKVLQNYSFKVKKFGIKEDGKKIFIRGKQGKDPNGKPIIISYKNSRLELNRYFQDCDVWDHNKILERQSIIQEYAKRVWNLREYDDQVRSASKNAKSGG